MAKETGTVEHTINVGKVGKAAFVAAIGWYLGSELIEGVDTGLGIVLGDKPLFNKWVCKQARNGNGIAQRLCKYYRIDHRQEC